MRVWSHGRSVATVEVLITGVRGWRGARVHANKRNEVRRSGEGVLAASGCAPLAGIQRAGCERAKVVECCDACAIKLPKIRGGEMLEALKQPRRVAVANADFEADPRAQHGRKNAFWALVTQ